MTRLCGGGRSEKNGAAEVLRCRPSVHAAAAQSQRIPCRPPGGDRPRRRQCKIGSRADGTPAPRGCVTTHAVAAAGRAGMRGHSGGATPYRPPGLTGGAWCECRKGGAFCKVFARPPLRAVAPHSPARQHYWVKSPGPPPLRLLPSYRGFSVGLAVDSAFPRSGLKRRNDRCK